MADANKDAIIKLANARMNEAYSADQPTASARKDDLKNVIGDQWPQDEREERRAKAARV